MAGPPTNNKRLMRSKFQKPMKRQRRERRVQKEYHSGSEDEDEDEDEGNEQQQQDFDAVNLLDSDDDIHNAKADDVGGDDGSDNSSSEEEAPPKEARVAKGSAKVKAKLPKKLATDDNSDVEQALPEAEDNDEDDDDDEEDEDMNDEFDLDDDDEEGGSRKPKKRNDPAAFATSLSKILSTKLSSSKRADPVLARSAAAHASSRAVVESALEAKAKRQLREHKRKAQEKGRVRDVLVATAAVPETTTSDILAAEGKLRKTAQRGVVKMFNAVRAAQVKSGEAERATRQAGVLGMGRREEKVNEMSKKGFLDLLASGGQALKKSASAIEEA